jgi:AraC-like DNA-binding protein
LSSSPEALSILLMYAAKPKFKLLAPFVDALWMCENGSPPDKQILLPNGRMQLLVDLSGTGLRDFSLDGQSRHRVASGMALQGPRTHPVVIDAASQRMACGVSFFPGGAAPFFPVAAFELVDRLVDLVDIWGRDAQAFLERVKGAKTAERLFEAIESVLIAKFRPACADHRRINLVASGLEEQRSIRSIEEELGMHARGFIAWFEYQFGPLPKQYARLARFQKLLRQWEDAGNWGGRAAAAGYSDQAHMNREFKLFAGITPSVYRPQSRLAFNHIEVSSVKNIQDK